MKTEIWKDLPGYEGLYQVSNFGRVRKLKILKPYISKLDYLQVNLTKNGKGSTKNIHRLIASAFLENTQNKPCVNHKDGDRQNNNVENLEWCTHSENNIHAFRVLNKINGGKNKVGLLHPKSKKILQINPTDGEVINIFYGSGEAQKAGFNKRMVTHCCNGKAKKHKGFYFKYAD